MKAGFFIHRFQTNKGTFTIMMLMNTISKASTHFMAGFLGFFVQSKHHRLASNHQLFQKGNQKSRVQG